MRRKKNYLLLELLIAFSLIALCALPLVRNPLACVQNDISSLTRIEIERVAEYSFALMKAELYNQSIPWKTFENKNKENPFKEDLITINIKGIINRAFDRKVYFKKLKEKTGLNNEEYRLVRLQIAFTPKGMKENKDNSYFFNYDLFLTRNITEDQKTNFIKT